VPKFWRTLLPPYSKQKSDIPPHRHNFWGGGKGQIPLQYFSYLSIVFLGYWVKQMQIKKLCKSGGEGYTYINPFNAELNTICHLLALLGAHPILHVSRIRVKK